MENYTCKECGVECSVVDGAPVRNCEHTGTILLNINITCIGQGGMNG